MFLSNRPLAAAGDERYFVGRDHEVEALEQAVRNDLNVVVVGGRGSGRTSLLRMVSHRLRRKRVCRVDYLTGCFASGPADLLHVLGDRLEEPPETPGPPDGSTETYEDLRTEGGRVLAALDRLRRPLDEHVASVGGDAHGPWWEPGSPLVVMVDDLDAEMITSLFNRARDLVWALPIVWVVSCTEDQSTAVFEPRVDEFFEVKLTVRPLDESSAVDLVRRRVAPDAPPQDLIDRLVATTDRTPRALVSAARFHFADGSTTEPDVERILRVRARAHAKVAAIGRSATMLVAELQARGGAGSASDPDLQTRLGWTRPRATQVFRQLEEAGLVTSVIEPPDGSGRPRKRYQLVEELR